MGLVKTHIGWENEHLATFLLSKVSFVASPLTVADDVGTDLFCTLFEVTEKKGTALFVPRSSIAVQVKSSKKQINAIRQLEYLARLEIPYYIGVVNQEALSLELFSARYLPLMLSYRGRHKRFHLVLVDELEDDYFVGNDKRGYKLLCPKVTTLNVNDNRDELQLKARIIRADEEQGMMAIASRMNKEYIFDAPTGVQIFTGEDSATTFRENFHKRYAEALSNLRWLLEHDKPVKEEEVNAYLGIYDMLSSAIEFPIYVENARERLLEIRRLSTQIV